MPIAEKPSHILGFLNIFDSIDEKQLLAKIDYLSATFAPYICQQRMIKVDGEFRMEKFSLVGLKAYIRNAVKRESDTDCSAKDLYISTFVGHNLESLTTRIDKLITFPSTNTSNSVEKKYAIQ